MEKIDSWSYGEKIANAGLRIGAIKINFNNPFLWSSGLRMPIYNDNRIFLSYPVYRRLISNAFDTLIDDTGISDEINLIAGTSTAGISPATTLADQRYEPLIYVRGKSKEHGLRNKIEGIDAESNLEGYRVLLIEDLVSTGGSAVRAVQTIRDAKGTCDYCLSIFNYGFDEAEKRFRGEIPYDDEGHKLETPCDNQSLLTYDTFVEIARKNGKISDTQFKMLEEWRKDPWNWGGKNGFPRIKK